MTSGLLLLRGIVGSGRDEIPLGTVLNTLRNRIVIRSEVVVIGSERIRIGSEVVRIRW